MTNFGRANRLSHTPTAAWRAAVSLMLAGAALASPTALAQTAGPAAGRPAPLGRNTGRAKAPGRQSTKTRPAPASPVAPAPSAPYTPPNVPLNSPATAQGPATPTAQGAVIGTAITQGASGPAGAKVLTLDQVVALAINSNSNVTLAQQRLRKAQEQIVQVDAQSRPQVSADLIDTYSSIDSFSTAGVTVASPSLPGGGQIPTVTDQGGGSTGTFTGGGGGGTANSNGSFSTTGGSTTSTGTAGTTTGTGAGTIGGNSGAGTIGGSTGTGTIGGGTSTGTGTSGTGGAGTGTGTGTGTGGAGVGGTGTAGTGATGMARMADLPPIVRQYTQATTTGVQTAQSGAKKPAAQALPAATVVDPTTGAVTGNTSRGQRNNYSGRLSVTQYIDIFGLIPAAKTVETVTRDFYVFDLARVQNESALNAKDYFFNVLRDQETINVDQEQVNYATENVRITQARYASGTAAQYDVLTAQVTLANDQQALQAAQNQINLDRANLNNLLGIDPNTQVTLQAPPLPPLDQPIDLSRGTQVAFQQRPELRQAENNILIAQKLIRLAGASLQPTFGVGASANYSGPGSTGTTNSTFNLSAELNIPLYDGGTTHSKVRQAQVDLQTQLTTRDQLRQNVTLEVRQAYLNVSNAQAQAATAGFGVSQAEEAVRLAQVRYQNGLGTFLDVINAQAQLATARNNLATAQYNYQTSLAQLIRAEGGR